MRNHSQTQAELAYHRSQLTSALETAHKMLEQANQQMHQLRTLETTLTTSDVLQRLATLEGQRLSLLHELRSAASHVAHIDRLNKQKELPFIDADKNQQEGGAE